MSQADVDRINLVLHYEKIYMAAPTRQLPVTILTGFLGSGKTTLLKHILKNRLNLRVCCCVSDVAALNVDEQLITDSKTRTSTGGFLMENGCMCCPVRLDLDDTSEFKDIVWQVLSQDEGLVMDYLVVETSGTHILTLLTLPSIPASSYSCLACSCRGSSRHVGTTDPLALIQAIQARFGKMTRARLDSVVTVVDAEALVDSALCPVAKNQLQCADVVLLNKMDLLADDPERQAAARAIVQQVAPRGVQVHETSFCDVYLPRILDISPPDGIYNAVSHESVQAHWNTAEASSLRRTNVNLDQYTVSQDTWTTEVFESISPISLAALHAYVGSRLPPTTLRAKGILYIQEDPTHRYVFQLSGKQRIQVVSTGVWPCAPSTQLAVIGTDFEFDQVQKDLETLSQNDLASDALACADLVRADDRFELVHVTASHIEFRVRCPVTTLDETMLRHHHHIDMDDLNEQLGVAVNLAGGGGGLVLTLPRPDVALLASVAGPHTLRTMWPVIDLHATKILHVVRRKLAECMCGF
ncbi:hypothetical protein DYB37_009032 [Aphanomyces astaci]|uniref:CobW C-terminal domain-containing protein n=1 Tax=Aphanomyces astaci TaxID=112090 RepID=A0A418F0A6_APHAT|nr:hypothetical protein DYB37_009032 [Aphanomyces astaci]